MHDAEGFDLASGKTDFDDAFGTSARKRNDRPVAMSRMRYLHPVAENGRLFGRTAEHLGRGQYGGMIDLRVAPGRRCGWQRGPSLAAVIAKDLFGIIDRNVPRVRVRILFEKILIRGRVDLPEILPRQFHQKRTGDYRPEIAMGVSTLTITELQPMAGAGDPHEK